MKRETDNSFDNRIDRNVRKTRKNRKVRPGLLFLIAFAVVFAGAFAACSALVLHNHAIYPGVMIDSVPVGGMTREQAVRTLEEDGWSKEKYDGLTLNTYGDISVKIDPVKAGLYLDADEAVEKALQIGRDGGIFHRIAKYLECRSSSTVISSSDTVFQADYVQEKITELCDRADELLAGRNIAVNGETLELTMYKTQEGVRLDSDGLYDRVLAAMDQGEEELSVRSLTKELVCPDFSVLSSMVRAEAEDARFSDDGTFTVIPERYGMNLEPEQAESLWKAAEPGDAVRIPLQRIDPVIYAEDLESMLFHDLLGAVTTKYNNSGANRCVNVRLAAEKVNGTIVYPGQEFSFNRVVGARTAEAGFLNAPAYGGYEDVTGETGGGVCQVSTGIYVSALYSFLDITAHTCHVHPTNYIQVGTDTAVTIPEGGGREVDFRFVNSKHFPIRIDAYCVETEENGKPLKTITVEIWGTLEENDYMPVEFDNSYAGVYDYDRIIEPAYPDREGYTIKLTHDEYSFEDETGEGIRTLTHRRVYDSNGNMVEDRIINRTYSEGFAMDTYYFRK